VKNKPLALEEYEIPKVLDQELAGTLSGSIPK